MDNSNYEWKISNLLKMLEAENNQPDNEKYGAHLTHWQGTSKPVNLDEGAIEALIAYYQNKMQ